MNSVLRIAILVMLTFNTVSCTGQQKSSNLRQEALSEDFSKSPPFYYKIPNNLSSTDTSPGYKQQGQKILLTGTVYEIDGETPASNVILYYYHTDIHGRYATNPDEPLNMPKNKLGQTQGYIRGWVQTGADGTYSIYTVMPGIYPSKDEVAHVHVTVMETSMEEPYYIDGFVFDNDSLLTSKRRKKMENRGGSGIIRFVQKDSLWVGERNIILGLNIPKYPKSTSSHTVSGKNMGEDVISFTPFHAFGPDKGTETCPICKYGWYHGILYFVGNDPNWTEIREWLTFLDGESQKREEYLKTFFIYGNKQEYSKEERMIELETLGDELQLKHTALTFVPSFSDIPSDMYLNEIDQDIENTFIIYKRSRIVGNFTNLKPTTANFQKLQSRLDQTTNEYFKLSRAEKN